MTTVSPHGDSDMDTEVEAARPGRPWRSRKQESGRLEDGSALPAEATVGQATPIEIDLTVDPPRVVVTVADVPSPQVFAGAAVFRPVLVSLVVAAAIVVGYGVVVLASVPFDGASPNTSPFDSAPLDRTIVASRGSFAEPGRCTEVSGRVFLDGDGNAIADPWDGDHDFDGIEVSVETDTGVITRLPVPVPSSRSGARTVRSPPLPRPEPMEPTPCRICGPWPPRRSASPPTTRSRRHGPWASRSRPMSRRRSSSPLLRPA